MANEEESLKIEMQRLIGMIESAKSGVIRVNLDPYLNSLTLATAKYLLLKDNVSKNKENFDI